jgi:NAD(P)H-hydrate epimerase
LLLSEDIKGCWIFNEYTIHADSVNIYSNKYTFSPDKWYIDGIFGIGLQGDIEGCYQIIIQKISKFPHIISIDIPSGIYGDSGMSSRDFIQSQYTLTMGYPKWGHYFNTGLQSTGDLFIMDIGFKPLKNTESHIKLIELEDVFSCAPAHAKDIHKYNRGKIISVAGSSGYTGACILAVDAALTVGAGIIKVLIPESLRNIYESCLTEAIMISMDDHDKGAFIFDHLDKILSEIEWADAVLFGPGLRTNSIDVKWMVEALKNINKPLILDASGFQPLIDKKMKIDELPQETILTPHYAEFSRIFALNFQKVKENPIIAVKSIIPKLSGRVLILKGATNIIVTSEGELLAMNHGTTSLATAGSGDVLAGILASVTAQGLDMNESAIYSTYLHAECAHQYYQHCSELGLTASDLIEMLPYAQEVIHHVS